jgi:hypothetical protein
MFQSGGWLDQVLGGYLSGGFNEHVIAGEEMAEARRPVGPDRHSIEAVEARLDRLELACEGLWELLKSKHNFTDEELLGWMAEIDLRDGSADGRKTKTGPRACAKCSRNNSDRHDYCMYCGASLNRGPF